VGERRVTVARLKPAAFPCSWWNPRSTAKPRRIEIRSVGPSASLLSAYAAGDGANRRTDAYGGSIENRVRFALKVVDAVVCGDRRWAGGHPAVAGYAKR